MGKILASLILAALPMWANADELDREPTNRQGQITGTVVIRVDNRTDDVAILRSDRNIGSRDEARALAAGRFTRVPDSRIRNELDRDAGSSSWYVYWGATPSYCNYGYAYTPYYYYNYGYYGYYYYGNPYARWWYR